MRLLLCVFLCACHNQEVLQLPDASSHRSLVVVLSETYLETRILRIESFDLEDGRPSLAGFRHTSKAPMFTALYYEHELSTYGLESGELRQVAEGELLPPADRILLKEMQEEKLGGWQEASDPPDALLNLRVERTRTSSCHQISIRDRLPLDCVTPNPESETQHVTFTTTLADGRILAGTNYGCFFRLGPDGQIERLDGLQELAQTDEIPHWGGWVDGEGGLWLGGWQGKLSRVEADEWDDSSIAPAAIEHKIASTASISHTIVHLHGGGRGTDLELVAVTFHGQILRCGFPCTSWSRIPDRMMEPYDDSPDRRVFWAGPDSAFIANNEPNVGHLVSGTIHEEMIDLEGTALARQLKRHPLHGMTAVVGDPGYVVVRKNRRWSLFNPDQLNPHIYDVAPLDAGYLHVGDPGVIGELFPEEACKPESFLAGTLLTEVWPFSDGTFLTTGRAHDSGPLWVAWVALGE